MTRSGLVVELVTADQFAYLCPLSLTLFWSHTPPSRLAPTRGATTSRIGTLLPD